MLVLSRKAGESIVIDDKIVVTVLDVRGDSVKLGVDAPYSVTIWRSEIVEDIKAQNRAAAQKNPDLDVRAVGELLSKVKQGR